MVNGKWWLDGKTGSDKRFFQQCMCSIITAEVTDSVKCMQSAKWIDRDRLLVAVNPARLDFTAVLLSKFYFYCLATSQ